MANNIFWGKIYEYTNWGVGVVNNISWGKIYADLVGALPSFALNFANIATDFTFTRSSFATRVNEQGLIETVTDLGSELVQNGDFEEISSELVTNGTFDTDSDWSLLGGWGISDGKANSSGSLFMYQNAGIQSNKIYKITYTVTDYTSGTFSVRLNGAPDADGVVRSGVGTYTEYLQASSYANGNFSLLSVSSFIGSIDNVSVKEVDPNDDWSFSNVGGSNGWRIADGRAICDTVNPLSGRNLHSTTFLTSGKTYKLTLDILQSVDGMTVLVGGTSLAVKLPIGTNLGYEYIIDSSLHTGGFFGLYAGSSDLQEIDNISIQEVFEDDVPRIDYTNGEGEFLLEPQSTNLLLYSEDFSQSFWNKSALNSIVSNSIISPNGNMDATKIIERSVINGRSYLRNVNAGGSTINPYSMSVFAKKGERTWMKLSDDSDGINSQAYFDLENGVVGNIGSNITSANIENYGNGWYRCEIVFTNTNTNMYTNISTSLENDDTYDGDGTSGIYIWGVQLEQLSYATSYIPTNGSTVTRSAETCVDATPTINSEEGTLYVEASALVNGGGVNRYISLSDGTSSNRIQLIYSSALNRLSVGGVVSGVSMTTISYTSFIQTNNSKIAFNYSANGVKLFVDGVERATNNNNASFPTGTLTNLDFSLWNSSSNLFYGRTKDLRVYTEALTDDELIELTTI